MNEESRPKAAQQTPAKASTRDSTPTGRQSTRDTPFQVLPPLSTEEYAALREDIAAHGMTVPVLVDERQRVVDGHHRVRIAADLGIDDYPQEIIVGRTDAQLRDMAFRLNLHRRHLSRDQVREALSRSLSADPGLSDRQHAVRVGASPTTAGSVRRDLQQSGDVSKLDTRTDSTGRQQPAAKPTSAKVAGIRDYFASPAEATDPLTEDSTIEPVPAPARRTHRRPLPDAWRDATYDAVKVVERLDRLTRDDRFRANREQLGRGDLSRIELLLAEVLSRLSDVDGGR